MSRTVQIAVAIVAAVAAFYGIRQFRQYETRVAIADKMDEMQAAADRKHPDMPKTDALKKMAAEEATRQLATKSAREQAMSAANMFWGFYFTNTVGRVEYCRARGVDIAPFVTAFDAAHADEKHRAQLISAKAGTDPAELRALLASQFPAFIEQDMKDTAMGAKLPLEQMCPFFNENAEQISQLIQMPEDVKRALMTHH
jgi:hypothetical protein